MRVVLDTNVLVSGVLNPHGAPGRTIDAIVLRVQHDDRILAEYREVPGRPAFAFDPDDVELLLDLIEREGEPVLSRPLDFTLPDADDLPFLEVAVSGAAEALISGNAKHFRPAHGRVSVPVLTPVLNRTTGLSPRRKTCDRRSCSCLQWRAVRKRCESATGFGRGYPNHGRAKTTNPFAGMVIAAEKSSPCIGGPEAEMPPPFPTFVGFTQLSYTSLLKTSLQYPPPGKPIW